MKTTTITALLAIAATAIAQRPEPAGFGGSILLPEFDPAQQTQKILDSLGRLTSVQDAIRDSRNRIGPLVEAYQKDPSIDHREALERELAGLTLQLSRNVERVIGEKEKVRFALQDLNRLSLSSERAVDAAVASLRSKADDEDKAMASRREQLERLARAVETAPEADKPQAMNAFKASYRDYRRIQIRQQVLLVTAQNHDNLLRGIRAVRRGFEAITGNLTDVFDRIEDAGSLLAFVAGIRKESADLLGQYQRLFGSGSDSLRDSLKTLASIEGQLDLVGRLTDSLDSAGSFATIIGQMEEFSRGLKPENELASEVPTSEDYWLNEVHKVTSGRFFQKEAKKESIQATGPAPVQGRRAVAASLAQSGPDHDAGPNTGPNADASADPTTGRPPVPTRSPLRSRKEQ